MCHQSLQTKMRSLGQIKKLMIKSQEQIQKQTFPIKKIQRIQNLKIKTIKINFQNQEEKVLQKNDF